MSKVSPSGPLCTPLFALVVRRFRYTYHHVHQVKHGWIRTMHGSYTASDVRIHVRRAAARRRFVRVRFYRHFEISIVYDGMYRVHDYWEPMMYWTFPSDVLSEKETSVKLAIYYQGFSQRRSIRRKCNLLKVVFSKMVIKLSSRGIHTIRCGGLYLLRGYKITKELAG